MTAQPEAVVERLARYLAGLYTRAGYPFEGADVEMYTMGIAQLLKLGQCTALSHDGMLVGWQAWYRFHEAGFNLMMQDGIDAVLRARPLISIAEGPYCYIAYTVAIPGAPAGVYRRLARQTMRINADAVMFGGHLVGRRGRVRSWLQKGT